LVEEDGRAAPRPAGEPLPPEDLWPAEEPWPAGEPPSAEEPWPGEESWPGGDCGPLPEWLDDDPEPDDPEQVVAWVASELARAAAWLDDDPEWADPGPAPREVLKAGRWDRSRGTGGGFAAGGAADNLPPGPVLAGLAGDRWTAGLGQLCDDELIGVLRAA